jgi:DNA-binding CsgD family transcriptional regulator
VSRWKPSDYTTSTAPLDLTPREDQVVALIAAGLTSEEIGRELGMCKRTVDAHAEHVRNKLGLHSRAQIAAWVIRQAYRNEHVTRRRDELLRHAVKVGGRTSLLFRRRQLALQPR